MERLRRSFRQISWMLRRGQREAELREELQFHLETEAEERESDGLPADAARFAASRELGNATFVHEEVRAVWQWTIVEQLGQDLRYAWRTLAANRAFTMLAVLSLALGIGANTAIYSFLEALLLRSLPVAEPQSLVVMKWRARSFSSVSSHGFSMSTGGSYRDPKGGHIGSVFPYGALELFQRNDSVLASAFAYFVADRLDVATGDRTDAVPGQYVTGDYFRGMGTAPAAGRLILPADDQAGAAPVAVLSYGLAQRRFGDPSSAVGQSIRINLKAFTVAGVAPPGFFGAEPGAAPEIYVPLHANVLLEPSSGAAKLYGDRNFYWLELMGRLKPGVTRAQALAVLGPQFYRFSEDSAATAKEKSDLPSLLVEAGAGGLDSLRRRYSKPLYFLMAMVALILLIACANVANLLLARATARRREMAVRLGLGAGRMRVIRQLLTESLLLATLGGALGVGFAFWGIRFVSLLLATGRGALDLRAGMNWNVLAVTLGLSALTGLLFGLAPALQATRVDVVPALKEVRTGAMAGPGRGTGRFHLGAVLVGAQVAFSLLLLVAAGLLGRTLSNLHSIELGFNRENVLLLTINARAAGYEGPALSRVYGDLREKLRQIPGVRAASLSSRPLPAGGGTLAQVTVPGAAPAVRPDGGPAKAGLFGVGVGFFETMQIPMVAGREFDERDSAALPQPAIVNRRFVKLFGLDNPLGRVINLHTTAHSIVGVVGDALFLNLKDELQPMIYLPAIGARPPGQVTYEVRAAGNPLERAAAVREAVRQVDSRLAISDMKSQAAHLDQAINQEITLSRLCLAFAVLALVIACVGLYGTVQYNAARRTGEIGIRMAMGAPRRAVVWLVVSRALALGVAGLAVGAPIALVASRYVESWLYGVKPNDPATLVSAIAILLAAVLVAGIAPAWRASRIDPLEALRHE